MNSPESQWELFRPQAQHGSPPLRSTSRALGSRDAGPDFAGVRDFDAALAGVAIPNTGTATAAAPDAASKPRRETPRTPRPMSIATACSSGSVAEEGTGVVVM